MREHFNDGVEFARFLAHRFVTDKAPNSAAALTYTTLFAVVPMMTVMFSMLSLIPAFHGMGESIQTFIFRNFVPSAGEAVETYLKSFTTQARHLTWVGVVFLAVTAFTMLVTIEKAFNEIWRVRQPRRGVGRFLLYWAILSLGPLLLGRLRRDHLHHFAVAAPWPGRVAGRGDAAGADAAGVQRGGLHPALFGGPERPGPGAPCPDGRRVHRGTVRSRENPVRAVRKPVSRLPVDLRCLRHRAYLPAVDLSFLDDRSVRRGAGLQSLFFPSLAAALAAQADRPARRAEGVPPAPAAWTVAAPDPLASCGLAVAEDEWEELLDFLEKEQFVCRAGGGEWVLCRDLGAYSLHRLLNRCPWPMPSRERMPANLDEAWYPPFQQAMERLQVEQEALFGESLAHWLADGTSGAKVT